MPYEQSKFGTGGAAGTGNVVSTVSNFFGQRKTGKTSGVAETEGSYNELVMDVDKEVLVNGAFFLTPPFIPAGSKITRVIADVQEAFTLTGTTPGIKLGTKTTESTNGVNLTQAQAQAIGMYDITASLAGTWLAGLTTRTTLGVGLSGTTPAITGTAGKVRFLVEYIHI
jgi:hypothetical protein